MSPESESGELLPPSIRGIDPDFATERCASPCRCLWIINHRIGAYYAAYPRGLGIAAVHRVRALEEIRAEIVRDAERDRR